MKKENLRIINKLGKGKSGISYLADSPDGLVVLKEMHNEEVSYYKFFKEKIELEKESYLLLSKFNIKIPELIFINEKEKYLIKEYIAGPTATEKLEEAPLADELIMELLQWECRLKDKNINIDYFPSNFVITDKQIYYIDYEHNNYTEEWNYSNWGIYYWLNHEGFSKYSKTGDFYYINVNDSGKPVKSEKIEETRKNILDKFKLISKGL